MSETWSRAALTLLTLAVFALGAYGMRRGWRRRAQRDADLLPLPTAPAAAAPPLAGPASGLLVGTTRHGDGLARVVAARGASGAPR